MATKKLEVQVQRIPSDIFQQEISNQNKGTKTASILSGQKEYMDIIQKALNIFRGCYIIQCEEEKSVIKCKEKKVVDANENI